MLLVESKDEDKDVSVCGGMVGIETWDKIAKVHNFIFYLPCLPSSKSLLSRRREFLHTEVGLLQPEFVGEMAATQKVKYL